MEIAGELSIDYLLKGNLLQQDNLLRIYTQLIQVPDGSVVWAERYDAPMDTIFDIQDDIVERVVGAVSVQINWALLSASRNKPITSLAAYDCWLRGMEQLRSKEPGADGEARRLFRQALEIDPNYSRAYAGLSQAYFNDWGCQLWEEWDATEKNAYTFAQKAVELDDTDHIVQMVLGRILLFRRQFDQAEAHIDKSLSLNPNDADCLVQIAFCKSLLGNPREGEALFQRALRLNPYRNIWYYVYGAFACFLQQRYQDCIDLALKGPLTSIWVDLPAYVAASYAYLGDSDHAAQYLNTFVEAFQKHITPGRQPHTDEIIDWVIMANPFRRTADRDLVVKGLQMAGLEKGKQPGDAPVSRPDINPPVCSFSKEEALWHITYGGTTVQLSEVKGFRDLVQLLSNPGKEFHCTVLMGGPGDSGSKEAVIDEKARQSYEARIRELQEAVADAEAMHDISRAEKANAELDQLVEHLSKTLGLGKKIRETNPPAERARAAVTWRIRSAIKKIDSLHPALGRHLTNTIQTGAFCCYTPERDCGWQV
jgi:tetratricopeptide (TPR) repeat protein